jgi:site-specific DNA-methyltransferase (adenine-specific)
MKPYYQDEAVTIYHGDCREVLPGLKPVRLVVTDPPYMFGMASTAQEGKSGGWGDMMNAATFYAVFLGQIRPLIENQSGAAWVFNSWRSFPVLARAAFEARWPIESLLVWDKVGIGPGGPKGLRPVYELAALFACPGFAIANRSLPDIWREPWGAYLRQTEHPAEKPTALLGKIIHESGDGVTLDPFMGSGSTLRAAKDLGRRAIGIEIEERYCEIAAKRMEQGALPFVERPAPAEQSPLFAEAAP